jgi:hypothetical protein
MPTVEAIRWFKHEFHDRIETAVEDTPYTLDMLTALACQETGYVWNTLREKGLPTEKVLELCVGDTLDDDRGRRAFPRNKAELLEKPNGKAMFDIARAALVEMAEHVPAYAGAARNSKKFCRGFGVFQYDLQFFLTDPDYFLERRYVDFDSTLGKALVVLNAKLKGLGWTDREELTDDELTAVAIAYNRGRYTPSKGLKQGHFDGKKYYGESFFDFLRLSKTVGVDGVAAVLPAAAPGTAPLAQPTPLSATGKLFAVSVLETVLNVRRDPFISTPDRSENVVARLPDGQVVQAVNGRKANGFIEVETSLNGALIRGFVAERYLRAVPGDAPPPVVAPSPTLPTSGITAVYMPRRAGTITKRTELANAHSLNEPGQPGRSGETVDERREELGAIIEWLAVDKASHKRYQPRSGLTFCNIYAHDYCHLAGAYLPRVWWTPGAIESLAQGRTVEPLYQKWIEEMRANGLFRWLRDFGPRFGWRQTGTLSKLQREVNQGGIGLIAARRPSEGPPGHIVAVVPETDEHRARRNTAGDVIAPLQSQAGTTNFRYGTGKVDWWKGARFADFSFWLHP